VSLVVAEGPMSWLIQSNEVAETVKKRPLTCPATCSSRSKASTLKAGEAVSQDDAAVR